MSQIRAAFVMEQTLGHVTHHRNLEAAAARHGAIQPTWIGVPYDLTGLDRYVPPYRNWSVRASLRARRALGRAAAASRFDALFFHTQVTALFAVDLMRRTPTVLSLDATPINYDLVGRAYGHRPDRGTWLDHRRFEMNRAAFRAARALVTWSAWAKASLVHDYGIESSRISVVPPGAADAYFGIGATRNAAVGDRPVRLLFVGGDFVRKGGPLLLDSAREARTRRRFEIHVVTKDPVESRPGVIVHRGIGPNSPELLRLFAAADAFVLPTHGDCLPLVLMEASAAGLPLIATRVGALSEVAAEGRSAIMMSPGDGHALRAAIVSMVDDEDLRLRFGRAARQLALERFSAATNCRRVLDLVVEVTASVASRDVA